MAVSYYQENIKLEEAMTIVLEQNVRVWDISGLHIKAENIPQNANIQKTFVTKYRNGQVRIGVQYTVEGDLRTHMNLLDEIYALEEMKDKFPHLFELYGRLIAFA